MAGEAGHVRLERPIDSSSDKTVCAPKVAEKGPYKGGTLGFINKPLTDPDFCSCRQVIRSALFPGNLEIHAEFLAFFVQNLQINPTIHATDYSSALCDVCAYGRAHSVKG